MEEAINRIAQLAMLCAALAAGTAGAQSYPAKPVRIVVPFAAGGGSDFVARQIAVKLADSIGQQFLVDNRGGAGGLIGIELTAKAPADGYTLMIMSASFSATAATNRPAFDPINTIGAVGQIGSSPFVMLMHPSLPAPTLKALIALARAKPEQVIYASAGNGSITHLAFESMSRAAAIKLTHVPYKGVAPSLTDLIAGQTHLTLGAYSTAEPHLKSGRLRALVVTGAKRSELLPDVPAAAETLPGVDIELWFGLMAPARTPGPIVDRLNRALNALLEDPLMRKHLAAQGLTAAGGTPQQFGSRIRRDYEIWVKVVRDADIKGS
ncbi:MAG: tripartite tricarboxylate transporter substrate binding protein [Burkholderiales bacterium]|nr:tripartite tricarboxylate transporter substrate binding protein [Burkholderiales bacterium]